MTETTVLPAWPAPTERDMRTAEEFVCPDAPPGYIYSSAERRVILDVAHRIIRGRQVQQ